MWVDLGDQADRLSLEFTGKDYLMEEYWEENAMLSRRIEETKKKSGTLNHYARGRVKVLE